MRAAPLLWPLTITASSRAEELLISAAASLTDIMKDIGRRYEKQSDNRILSNFGASSLLARQIEQGMPAGLFVSANEAQMDRLEKAGAIEKGTRIGLLTNKLVIVARRDSPIKIDTARDLAKPTVSRIVIADPQSVPAGIYARQFLTSAGIWERVQGTIVPTENVRADLAVVEAGNAEVGIVYATDASVVRDVHIMLTVPEELSPKITYPAALVANSANAQATRRFLAFLNSNEAAEIFQNAGFGVVK